MPPPTGTMRAVWWGPMKALYEAAMTAAWRDFAKVEQMVDQREVVSDWWQVGWMVALWEKNMVLCWVSKWVLKWVDEMAC